MWIGYLRENRSTPLELNEPVKALGVYYSYDQGLLLEKNLIERLDSVKKFINIWSARGLSLYGRITVIKSLIIPVCLHSIIINHPQGGDPRIK